MSAELVVSGDQISRLVQLHAKHYNVRFTWTGEANADIAALFRDYTNKTLLNQCLWGGMRELIAMPEIKDLPEAIQAKIYSIVLKAQGCFELEIKNRDAKLLSQQQTVIGAK